MGTEFCVVGGVEKIRIEGDDIPAQIRVQGVLAIEIIPHYEKHAMLWGLACSYFTGANWFGGPSPSKAPDDYVAIEAYVREAARGAVWMCGSGSSCPSLSPSDIVERAIMARQAFAG